MSVDSLQEKIRKTKNPSVLELPPLPSQLPPVFREGLTAAQGLGQFCALLLEELRGKIPAVRIDFSAFALLGGEGLDQLCLLLRKASDLGYYVMMNCPTIFSSQQAQFAAESIWSGEKGFPCDALVIPAYSGSDLWKPFLPWCAKGKDIFVAVRTGNKSSSELQDLLAGSRMVHIVAADHVNRYGGDCVGKSGYSRVGVMASASFQEGLRTLRSKYPRLFLLVDGYDYPSANAKNCAPAFDKLGHGAAVCAGASITCAWKQAESDGSDYLAQAVCAADRMKKNLSRYITVL